ESEVGDGASQGKNWTGRICIRDRAELANRSAIEDGGSIQVDSAINSGQMLMHVVSAQEKPFGNFALCPNGRDLAARIIKLIRIIRQPVEIQAKPRELCRIELSVPRSDGDIACG